MDAIFFCPRDSKTYHRCFVPFEKKKCIFLVWEISPNFPNFAMLYSGVHQATGSPFIRKPFEKLMKRNFFWYIDVFLFLFWLFLGLLLRIFFVVLLLFFKFSFCSALFYGLRLVWLGAPGFSFLRSRQKKNWFFKLNSGVAVSLAVLTPRITQ